MSIINAHAEVNSKVRGFKFGLSLHLHIIYSMYAQTPESSLLTDAIVPKSRVLSPYTWHVRVSMLVCSFNAQGRFPVFLG